MKVIQFSAALLILFGCNTTASRIPFREEKFQVQNESVLYIYRERSFVGGSVESVFFFDGKSVGLLPQNAYYPIHALPGKHTLRGCSASLVASEECEDIELDLPAGKVTVLQIVMKMGGSRLSFVPRADTSVLADFMNEGNYYEPALRGLLPATSQKIPLTPSVLKQNKSAKGNTTLRLAILNFSDRTNSNLYGWLSESLPDAIDQSLNQNFVYKRSLANHAFDSADKLSAQKIKQLAEKFSADLLVMGHYSLATGSDSLQIDAQIYFADSETAIATASIRSPIDSRIFNATKLLSEKLLKELHEVIKQ